MIKFGFDVPLIGVEPTNKAIGLLNADLIWRETEKLLENNLKLHKIFKIAELRKSCGVKNEGRTINIRRPPRYQETFSG